MRCLQLRVTLPAIFDEELCLFCHRGCIIYLYSWRNVYPMHSANQSSLYDHDFKHRPFLIPSTLLSAKVQFRAAELVDNRLQPLPLYVQSPIILIGMGCLKTWRTLFDDSGLLYSTAFVNSEFPNTSSALYKHSRSFEASHCHHE